MEHIYTIRVKRPLDPRGLLPSERLFSASTVRGLACLHLAVAVLAALLGGLALHHQTAEKLTLPEEINYSNQGADNVNITTQVNATIVDETVNNVSIAGDNNGTRTPDDVEVNSQPNDVFNGYTSTVKAIIEDGIADKKQDMGVLQQSNEDAVIEDDTAMEHSSHGEIDDVVAAQRRKRNSDRSFDDSRLKRDVENDNEKYATTRFYDEKVSRISETEDKSTTQISVSDGNDDDEVNGDSGVKIGEVLKNDTNDNEVTITKQKSHSREFIVGLMCILMSVTALLAGITGLRAASHWYERRAVAWFCAIDALAAIAAVLSVAASVSYLLPLFTSKSCTIPRDVSKQSDGTYLLRLPGDFFDDEDTPRTALCCNILIASIVEFVWSLLSLRAAWRGARSPSSASSPATLCTGSAVNAGSTAVVDAVSSLKGTSAKRLPRNTRILPPRPDLIEHQPKDDKIEKFFRNQRERGGLFVQASGGAVVGSVFGAAPHETGAEHRARLLSFLKQAEQRDTESAPGEPAPPSPAPSWGDPPVYDQNTLDLRAVCQLRGAARDD